MAESSFDKQQKKLWGTVDKLRDEYRKYLQTLSKEELVEEFLEASVDRFYAAFTTDLFMNFLLEEGFIDEKEANSLPIEYFKDEIAHLKELRAKKKGSKVKVVKKVVKKATKKTVKKPAKKAVKKVAKKAAKKTTKKAVKKKATKKLAKKARKK